MRSRYALLLAALLLFPASALADTGFSTTLSGAEEVPPVATPATGYATLTLNNAQTQLTYSITYSGLLGTVTASHIHQAPIGTNGGVIFGFSPPLGTTSGNFGGVIAVNAAQVANLLAGLYYINIHTTQFGGGEIRGQISGDATPTHRNTWGRIKSLYRR